MQQGRVGEPVLIRKNLENGLQNGMTGEIAAIHRDGSIKVEVQAADPNACPHDHQSASCTS